MDHGGGRGPHPARGGRDGHRRPGGSCRLLDAGPDGAAGAVGVRLDIHAPADAPLPELAAQVRERVWEAADRELGLVVAVVDIRVTDLVPAGTEHGQEGRTR